MDFVAKTVDGGQLGPKCRPPSITWAAKASTTTWSPSTRQSLIVYVGGSFNGTDANGNFINQVLETTDGGADLDGHHRRRGRQRRRTPTTTP